MTIIRWIAAGVVWAALASNASAQVGMPVPTSAFEINGAAVIEPTEGLIGELDEPIHQLGLTVLVSSSPGGPLLASFFQGPPFPKPDPESIHEEIGFAFPGAPPGSYWVLLVVGATTTTNAPASAWVPLVIPGRCTGLPSPPMISGNLNGSTVTLNVGGGPGCAWNHINLEVGSSPGASNITVFPAPEGPFTVQDVPAGVYYVRARAVNQFGVSPPSIEVPITVPEGCMTHPQAPTGFTGSVGAGNTVTVSWQQANTTGITFYQLYLVNSQGYITDTVLLPPSQTSVSAVLPSGTYQVGIQSGGPCGVAAPLPAFVTLNVP